MGKRIFIISNGVINDPEFIRQKLKDANAPVILCADGAARYLRLLNIIPNFIIGDMDSIDDGTVRYFDEKGSTILTYPSDKDETDTQLALEYALKLQPDEIFIFGALGGRTDHALANIALLIMGVKQGVHVKIVDEMCEIFIVNQQSIVEGEAGQTVSLLLYLPRLPALHWKGLSILCRAVLWRLEDHMGSATDYWLKRGLLLWGQAISL